MATTNRNKVIQWEITYPQSGETPKETFHSCFPPCSYSICAKEAHADGNPHLHLGIKLKKGISKANLLKFVEKNFPDSFKRIHISPIKSWEQWIDYCHKEDPDPAISGSLSQKLSKVEKVKRAFDKHPDFWVQIGCPTPEEWLQQKAEEDAKRERIAHEMAVKAAKAHQRMLEYQLSRLDAM